MKLYIRTPDDDPHQMDDDQRHAVCGVDLFHAKEISEKQALVFLGDNRCKTCCPHHATHVWKVGH